MANEKVIELVKQTGEWISANAANVVGTDEHIEAGQLRVSFVVENDHINPKVKVERVHLT